MKRVLQYCSSNPGKLREFAMAAERNVGLDVRIEPLPGLSRIAPPPEDAPSFQENAEAKSIYYSRFTSDPVFADDSGLEVDALGGAPGVYSARFAGPRATAKENNNLLLARMVGIADRRARFVCFLGLAREGTLIASFRGVVDGTILHESQGDNGFGYDPLFLFPALNRSFGELDATQKLSISHRGRAIEALFQYFSRTAAQ